MKEIQITNLLTKEKFYITSESQFTVVGDLLDWFEERGLNIWEEYDYEIIVL